MNVTGMNDTQDKPYRSYLENSYIPVTIVVVVALCLCIVGLVGNVIVFWYLCFKNQRNKYEVYIMNLSVADALFIIFTTLLLMLQINTIKGTDPDFIGKESLYLFIEIFYDTMQYSGMYILTAVSMERCSSVLFPFWYRSHRPRNLSTIMCIALWILGSLESLLKNLACTEDAFLEQTSQCLAVQIIVFILAIGICLPIMVISSFTLLIKVKRSLNQRYTPKLYIIILIAVLVFILSVLPFTFLSFLLYLKLTPTDSATVINFYVSTYCTVLNCAANPYIYFIVGRKWKQKTPHSIQEALQRAFRDEPNTPGSVCTRTFERTEGSHKL
ncbi:mas-related G-protein coupled receptor member D-like [Rana temporaria]|uniref:mas-related G-protein coupled receptor member D-like n=1 Tax=Rana temporaria TaxID=8407 RepID=UPI001AADFE37|nr:mas-related G-protein coupled receptor member D-like [Rana temporaria]